MSLAPEERVAQVPLMSLAEARARKLDVVKMRTCAVRDEGRVAGCGWAPICLRSMFSRPEHGGFGPKGGEPGTGGEGPEYVQFYHYDAASNTEREGQMMCTAFMASMYDMYRQQDQTGDRIIIYPQGTAVEFMRMVPKVGTDGVRFLASETVVQEAWKRREQRQDAERDERAKYRERIAEKHRQMRMNARLSGATDAENFEPVETPAVQRGKKP